MISASAVRMAVKNRLIVAALRDQREYDPTAISDAAREQLAVLAAENTETADRLDDVRAAREPAGWDDDADANAALRDEDHRRRPTVHRLLAAKLLEMAADPGGVSRLVDEARSDAAEEIGREVVRGLHARDFAADPDYETLRAERLRDLIEIDLANIALAQGVELRSAT